MEARGLRPSQVARFSDVSHTMVTNWLRGARPTPDSVTKVARALGIPRSELMDAAGYGDEPEESPAGEIVTDGDVREFARMPKWLQRLILRIGREIRMTHQAFDEVADAVIEVTETDEGLGEGT